jgi:hypothetical protein
MYENSPREMLKIFGLDWSIYGDLILGGEAAMWSEQVTDKQPGPNLMKLFTGVIYEFLK